MRPADLVLVVHNHQPVGNFEGVFAAAFDRAYRPFLAVLERHPDVHVTLHQSGPVWEWMEQHHPDDLARLAAMVGRGQVELLGGGYYEPILAAIPERDRLGQLEKLAVYLERRFGVRPRGAWIAERIWEPALATTLVRAGIESCILDDAHFEAAGVPNTELDGYHLVEGEAGVLRVFPIRRLLRYQVPFGSAAAALADVRAAAERSVAAQPVFVLGDDGEKFGLWDGTHQRCYEEGWLDEFFARLASGEDGVRARTISEVADSVAPRGRVHLPEAAYAEMMEWALPPAGQRALRRARARLETDADAASLLPHLRGAPWRNFFVKYPESRRMHRRMLEVSAAVDDAARLAPLDPQLVAARDALWRAQCGCAYWHGLFGGLYLSHLRDAVYGALLRAENATLAAAPAAAGPAATLVPGDTRSDPEIRLRSRALQAFVAPHSGGALFELDDRRRGINLLDLVTRREEAYHDAWRNGAAGHEAAVAPARDGDSNHTDGPAPRPAAALVAPDLIYDVYRRGSCIDHALTLAATPSDFDHATLPEQAALAGEPYTWQLEDGAVRLERCAPIAALPGTLLHVAKHVRLDGPALEVRYELHVEGDRAFDLLFGIEMAVNLRAGDAPDRFFEIPGRRLEPAHLASRGSTPAVSEFRAVDAALGLRVVFQTDAPMDVWRAPLETISMSEHGCERVYQGSALLFVSRLTLSPGQRWTRVLRQSVELR